LIEPGTTDSREPSTGDRWSQIDAPSERGPAGSGGWLEQACKLIVSLRAGVLLVTVLELAQRDDQQRPLALIALVAAGVASFVPLRFWDRVGPSLVRHPAYLAAELVLATVILLFTGVQSAFFYYTLGTALLGGLLYGWPGAALFSPMLIGVYFWVLSVRSGVDDVPLTFQVILGQPALYALVAAAGAGARGVLDRQAAAETMLATQEREMAAQTERARLARDMHDSLAKTVSGIGFAALALARRIERDPKGAADEARRLAEDARVATREARELITGLRDEHGRALPLPAAVRSEAEKWSAASGVAVQVAVEEVGELDAVASRELEWILREALRNVVRHAHASTVQVRLRTLGGRAVLTVADDGDGFDAPDDIDELARGRHFGVVGMRERAQLAGGDLSVESAPGEGCVLSVWVPAAPPQRTAPAVPVAAPARRPAPAPVASAPAPDAEPSDSVPRAVPGFTWQ
jgi:signal transduction histidine kinase